MCSATVGPVVTMSCMASYLGDSVNFNGRVTTLNRSRNGILAAMEDRKGGGSRSSDPMTKMLVPESSSLLCKVDKQSV